ncbi:MAG: recombinase family protein [Paraclostridium sp.]
MKNIVAYTRVSSTSQIDNTSLEMQLEKIKGYCSLYNINLIKVFSDEGLSASTTARAKYNDMMEFVTNKENLIDGIIVYKADRVHRSLKNLMIMIDALNDIDVSFLSITEQFDTSTAQGLLFLQMLGSFSEFERKLIAERTKSGRISNGEKKLHAGGRIPFGYSIVEGEKRLTINYEEAEIIKDIFKARCKGSSFNTIAKQYQTTKQRINYIVKNKVYIGIYDYHGKKEKNKIRFEVPRIVTDYTYNKANSINKTK